MDILAKDQLPTMGTLIAELKVRHRLRARAEDRIHAARP